MLCTMLWSRSILIYFKTVLFLHVEPTLNILQQCLKPFRAYLIARQQNQRDDAGWIWYKHTWRRVGQQIEVTFSFFFGFLKKTTNSTPLILSHIKRFHLKFRLHLNRKERRKEVEEARLWGHLLTGKITLKYFSISSLLKIMGVGTHQRGMAQTYVTVRLTGAKKESMSRKMSLGTSVLVRGNK